MIAIYVRPGVRTGNRRQESGEGTGADPADLGKVQEFASQAGLDVIEMSAPRRSVVVWGTAAAITGAFRVELAHYDYAGKLCRGQIGPVHLPPTIAHIVEGVSGLDSGFPDLVAGAATQPRGLPRLSTRQIAIPVVVFLVGCAAVLVSRGGVFERSTSRHAGRVGQTVGTMPAVVPLSPATARQLHDAGASRPLVRPGTRKDPAQLELAAWRSLNTGRLREAQDYFLRVLALDPGRSNAMRGLVAVRRRMDDDNPRLIRQQVAAYRAALTRGVAVDDYAPSALTVLISAGLTAAQELESQPAPAAVAGPVKTFQTPARPAKPADEQIVTAAPDPHLPRSAEVTSPPAPPVPAPVSTPSQPIPAPGPVPAAVPTATAPAQPSSPPSQVPPAAAPQTPAPSRQPLAAPPAGNGQSPPPAPARQTPAAPNPLYMVQIGPVLSRDRAAAVAKLLSAEGFGQAQITQQTGYRVVSEPLPRKVAEDLVATLAGRGLRSYPEPSTGDSVQLLFGIFASQKDAEALLSRVAATGYDPLIREGPAYILRLGPYAQASVNAITGIVKAGAPEATVASDPVSTP